MTCREFIEFLAEYLGRELSAEQRAEFDSHLAVCPACVNYVASYQKAVRLGKTALLPTGETVPDDVPAPLIKAVLAARRKSQS